MIGRMLAALLRGAVSQLHPAMLALLLVPFALAALGWAVVAWYVWDPLFGWLRESIFAAEGPIRWLLEWLAASGFQGIRHMAAVLVASLVILPLWFATALTITAVVAVPVVLRFLSARGHRDLERLGRGAMLASVWNAVSSLGLFIAGYLLTMPLWLLPPLAVLLPWFWWSWLCARVMRFDTLVEHASPDERRALIARHRLEYGLLGAAVTSLNYIPPLFLVTPVLSALVFAHFSLARLREARRQAITLEPDVTSDVPTDARSCNSA